jgi:hypothetical protein
MRRVDMNREDSGGAGNLYRISFECLVTDYSAKVLFTEVESLTKELEITGSSLPEENEAGDEPLYDVE